MSCMVMETFFCKIRIGFLILLKITNGRHSYMHVIHLETMLAQSENNMQRTCRHVSAVCLQSSIRFQLIVLRGVWQGSGEGLNGSSISFICTCVCTCVCVCVVVVVCYACFEMNLSGLSLISPFRNISHL